jgi:membrane-associated phospholipid phosphatase
LKSGRRFNVTATGRLRTSEWVLLIYFLYVATIGPWFSLLAQPLLLAGAVALLLLLLAYAESRYEGPLFSMVRDWVPLGLTLAAYREMNWFTPRQRDYHLELRWVEWDRALLHGWGLQRGIESLGVAIPLYLELCYLLVYAVGPFAVATLYVLHRRWLVDRVVLLYLVGTLASYALFPYFPSEPPRSLFGASDLPNVVTGVRQLNLWMVGGYGIHSSVFPSAHVSSAFSAAWALLLFIPDRKSVGWGMLIYAISVAVAVVYGRYHYAVDSVAGFAVSLVAAGVGVLVKTLPQSPLRLRDLP